VNGAGLADFPTNGEQFVERSFVDQIAGVVLAVPGEIGRERLGVERGSLQKRAELLGAVKSCFRELAEFGDEIVD